MNVEQLNECVHGALDELKAKEITRLDVRGLTSIADILYICTGSSTRHVKSIAEHVVEKSKLAGLIPLGVEGGAGAEWVLVDLGDIVVHVFTREMRDYYQIEKLWDPDWGKNKSLNEALAH